MRSATVGRAIVTTEAHENAVISDHFLRVAPSNPALKGWLYAYIKSPQVQSIIGSTQYASVIRHIEPRHLLDLPVPEVDVETAQDFQTRLGDIVKCRNEATRLRKEAEDAFAAAIGPIPASETDAGFSVKLGNVFSGRRRFEAAYHVPHTRAIIGTFKKSERLGDIVERIWWPNRFRRVFLESGTPYMSADDLFTANPYALKSVAIEGKKDIDEFTVEPGWLIMARSGQTYGLNGSAMLTTEDHKRYFISEDMIRIKPRAKSVPAGYLLTALTHPTLGRPLLIREAYGMSIPHLDPSDVADFPIVRFDAKTEAKIADLAERAAAQQAKAEVLERELAEAAGKVISDFLVKPTMQIVDNDEADLAIARKRLARIDAQPESVLRGEALEAKMKQWES